MVDADWETMGHDAKKKAKRELLLKMRAEPTHAEAALLRWARWCLPAARWILQHKVCGYIVDVYSERLKIALEADGSSHEGKAEYDEERDEALRRSGVVVIHYHNDTILGAKHFGSYLAADLVEALKIACPRSTDLEITAQAAVLFYYVYGPGDGSDVGGRDLEGRYDVHLAMGMCMKKADLKRHFNGGGDVFLDEQLRHMRAIAQGG